MPDRLPEKAGSWQGKRFTLRGDESLKHEMRVLERSDSKFGCHRHSKCQMMQACFALVPQDNAVRAFRSPRVRASAPRRSLYGRVLGVQRAPENSNFNFWALERVPSK